jgi:hypothetical protein
MYFSIEGAGKSTRYISDENGIRAFVGALKDKPDQVYGQFVYDNILYRIYIANSSLEQIKALIDAFEIAKQA